MSLVINPLKGKTDYGWHFEQNVYSMEGITRAVKAGGGSGNIPKVIEIVYESDAICERTPIG
jgi:DNA (cytosine-5)-methyltransferase 1